MRDSEGRTLRSQKRKLSDPESNLSKPEAKRQNSRREGFRTRQSKSSANVKDFFEKRVRPGLAQADYPKTAEASPSANHVDTSAAAQSYETLGSKTSAAPNVKQERLSRRSSLASPSRGLVVPKQDKQEKPLKKKRHDIFSQVEYFEELLMSSKKQAIHKWKQTDIKNAIAWAELMERKRGTYGEIVPMESPVQDLIDALLDNPALSERLMSVLVMAEGKTHDKLSTSLTERIQRRGDRSALLETVRTVDHGVAPFAKRIKARLMKSNLVKRLENESANEVRELVAKEVAQADEEQLSGFLLQIASHEGAESVLQSILEDEIISCLDGETEGPDLDSNTEPKWFKIEDPVLRLASLQSLKIFKAYAAMLAKHSSFDHRHRENVTYIISTMGISGHIHGAVKAIP